MKILFLSQFYPPEPGFKCGEFAQELIARGHQVTVLTGFPNYPQGRIYPGYRQRLWQREQIDGVEVIRLPLYPNHSRSAVLRAANYLSFALSAAVLGPAMSGPADVMWVYHPPMTISAPAWWIKLLRGIPFVYAVHDMWPESITATGMLSDGAAIRTLQRYAHWTYRQARAVVVVSPGFKSNLVAKGVPPEKIHVIPNWADGAIYRPLRPDPALAAEHGLAGRFNVVYGGNIGAAQALGNLLDAAELLRDRPEVQFVLIGDGLEAPDLRRRAAERRLDNVRFIGPQPAERMPDFFALADVLLTHLKRDPVFKITIPSKTLAYLACSRPILAAVEGDAADVVRNAGAGMVCQPEDPDALARAVRVLADLPTEARERMGRSGRESFLRDYARGVLVGQYETLFKQVAGESTRSRLRQ